jgi:hypothetical protein
MPGVVPVCREAPAHPVSRRGLLTLSLGALATLASGCTHHAHPQTRAPTALSQALDGALVNEALLISIYDGLLAQPHHRSRFGPYLTMIRAAHVEHRTALVAAGAQPPSQSPTPTTPARFVAPLPASLAALAGLEDSAAGTRGTAAIAVPVSYAPLFASLAAAEAAHAALLRVSG